LIIIFLAINIIQFYLYSLLTPRDSGEIISSFFESIFLTTASFFVTRQYFLNSFIVRDLVHFSFQGLLLTLMGLLIFAITLYINKYYIQSLYFYVMTVFFAIKIPVNKKNIKNSSNKYPDKNIHAKEVLAKRFEIPAFNQVITDYVILPFILYMNPIGVKSAKLSISIAKLIWNIMPYSIDRVLMNKMYVKIIPALLAAGIVTLIPVLSNANLILVQMAILMLFYTRKDELLGRMGLPYTSLAFVFALLGVNF
jgi:hypothetical protein